MPDNSALAGLHKLLRRLDPEILVMAASLFHTHVEQDEIVHQLDEPVLITKQSERLVKRALRRIGSDAFLLPTQPELLRRVRRRVIQTFGIVARHHQLHRGEEGADEQRILQRYSLPDAFANRDGGPLEFNQPHCQAIDIKHQIGAALVLPGDRHLLGNCEMVAAGVLPVDQFDCALVFPAPVETFTP